jgi:hypothetical protein
MTCALAILHAVLFAGAPLADAVLDGGLPFGPHFETIRNGCPAVSDHFCCAFCRLLATRGTGEASPRLADALVVMATARPPASLMAFGSTSSSPVSARAPPGAARRFLPGRDQV